MPLRFMCEGESIPLRPCMFCHGCGDCCKNWKGECVAGREIDWRGLYFPGTPKGLGEAPLGKPGLCEANWPGNGNAERPWLLEADDVGSGGENGSGGY